MKLLPAAYTLPEPIRPRHWRCAQCDPDWYATNPVTKSGLDHRCGGAGFLYPDPPDWWNWETAKTERAGWYDFCALLYRVLGVVEDTDA